MLASLLLLSMEVAIVVARFLAAFVSLFAPAEALIEVEFLGMRLSSKTVSWPKLFVPRMSHALDANGVFRFALYARRWYLYARWHVMVVLREIDSGIYRGLDVLLRAFVPPAVLLAIGYSTTIRNNKLQAIIDAIDGGAGAGTNKWYNGSRPATGGAATTLLGTLTFSDPSATKANGVLTFSAITPDSGADATSTVTWGRVADSSATFCFDHGIATSASDMIVNTDQVVTGAQLSVSSWTVTEGNA